MRIEWYKKNDSRRYREQKECPKCYGMLEIEGQNKYEDEEYEENENKPYTDYLNDITYYYCPKCHYKFEEETI